MSQNGPAMEYMLDLDYQPFKFPGGEQHFKLQCNLMVLNSLKIVTDLSNSDEIMQLVLLADTFRHKDKYLELLYTPYARQDRRTSHEEPFSLRAFAKLINMCGFKQVRVHDPHSDVTAALIDNIFVVKRLELVKMRLGWIGQPPSTIIISPDAGAMKANQEIAQHFKLPHVSATKIRDIATGEITATQIHTDISLEGKDLIVLDDICDGGRTFIELAKVLRTRNPASIHLYTTVSISQKGRDAVAPYFTTTTFNHKLGE